jgi:hypothetical protein
VVVPVDCRLSVVSAIAGVVVEVDNVILDVVLRKVVDGEGVDADDDDDEGIVVASPSMLQVHFPGTQLALQIAHH